MTEWRADERLQASQYFPRSNAGRRAVTNLVILIPLALVLGGLGLAAFLWCLRSGQFDDLDGAAHRILLDDEPRPGLEGENGTGPTRRSRKRD